MQRVRYPFVYCGLIVDLFKQHVVCVTSVFNITQHVVCVMSVPRLCWHTACLLSHICVVTQHVVCVMSVSRLRCHAACCLCHVCVDTQHVFCLTSVLSRSMLSVWCLCHVCLASVLSAACCLQFLGMCCRCLCSQPDCIIVNSRSLGYAKIYRNVNLLTFIFFLRQIMALSSYKRCFVLFFGFVSFLTALNIFLLTAHLKRFVCYHTAVQHVARAQFPPKLSLNRVINFR